MRDVCKTLELIPWHYREELRFETLAKQVANCTRCALAGSRKQTVFGVGNVHSPLMIIGEAPGFYEDQQGEPFVGRAGALLTEMLKAFDLERSDVYIANILKCRPPENRDPTPEEAANCTPYLLQQINWIKPKMILALGRIAAQNLLDCKESLAKLRGKVHMHAKTQTKLFVSYHPAYLLRSPQDKKAAFADWQEVMKLL